MDNSKKDKNVAYICEGSCNAQITQEQYNNGLVKCGAKNCNLYNKPFKKVK